MKFKRKQYQKNERNACECALSMLFSWRKQQHFKIDWSGKHILNYVMNVYIYMSHC